MIKIYFDDIIYRFIYVSNRVDEVQWFGEYKKPDKKKS